MRLTANPSVRCKQWKYSIPHALEEEAREPLRDRRTDDLLVQVTVVVEQVRTSVTRRIPGHGTTDVGRRAHRDERVGVNLLRDVTVYCQRCVWRLAVWKWAYACCNGRTRGKGSGGRKSQDGQGRKRLETCKCKHVEVSKM